LIILKRYKDQMSY